MYKLIQSCFLAITVLLFSNETMAQRLVPGKPSTKLLQVQRPSKALNPIHGSAVGREELPSLKTLDLFKHLNGQANGYYVLPKTSALPKKALQANQKVALALGEVQVQLGLNQVDGSFLVKETLKDELGMQHTRFVQMHEGMEVWGAEMILHEKGSEQFLNGHFMAEPIISNKVVLSSSDALIKAIYYLKGATEWQDLSESQIRLTQYVGPKARKVVYPFKDLVLDFLAYFNKGRSLFIDDFNKSKSNTSPLIMVIFLLFI
jgi:3-hydroxymyristoyl/3-hydroxydecanoyl-(acyl carrier protein) dehydratase